MIIVGKKYSQYPKIFDEANIKLKDEIIFNGYCESRQEYISKIRQSNILPVTSNQIFWYKYYGSYLCGNYPVLPERLTYPELFDIENNHDIFYKNDKEFERKLIQVIENINNFNIAILQKELLDKFDWNRMSALNTINYLNQLFNFKSFISWIPVIYYSNHYRISNFIIF